MLWYQTERLWTGCNTTSTREIFSYNSQILLKIYCFNLIYSPHFVFQSLFSIIIVGKMMTVYLPAASKTIWENNDKKIGLKNVIRELLDFAMLFYLFQIIFYSWYLDKWVYATTPIMCEIFPCVKRYYALQFLSSSLRLPETDFVKRISLRWEHPI